jgi:hypothetical protein
VVRFIGELQKHRRPAPRSRAARRLGGRTLGLLLAPATALAIAACGSTHTAASAATSTRPGSTSRASTPTTTTPTTKSTTSATTTPSTSSTATTPATPTTSANSTGSARCRSAQLQITERSYGPGHYTQAALGHSSIVVLFTNRGQSACALVGYPGVAGLNAAGTQVTQARRTPSGYMGGLSAGATAPPVVTLQPNQTASAIVEGTDVPSGNQTTCPTLSGLLVTAPNTTRSVRLPAAPADCSGLQVHPVVPGDSGTSGG